MAIQAVAFLLIPLILWITLGERLQSISAYVNHTPITFAFSLTLAGALFIYGGIVQKMKGYNVYIGAALFGVILLNHLHYPVAHYSAAGIFFIGSLFNMVFFSSNKERLVKSLVAFGVLFGMAGTFIFHWYSIFWAEWIGMVPISIHYALESLNKID